MPQGAIQTSRGNGSRRSVHKRRRDAKYSAGSEGKKGKEGGEALRAEGRRGGKRDEERQGRRLGWTGQGGECGDSVSGDGSE